MQRFEDLHEGCSLVFDRDHYVDHEISLAPIISFLGTSDPMRSASIVSEGHSVQLF